MLKKIVFAVICFSLLMFKMGFAEEIAYCPPTFESDKDYPGWMVVSSPATDKPLALSIVEWSYGAIIGCMYPTTASLMPAILESFPSFMATVLQGGEVIDSHWYRVSDAAGSYYRCEAHGNTRNCPFIKIPVDSN